MASHIVVFPCMGPKSELRSFDDTFSYYDPVLNTTTMLGAVPRRYGWNGGEIGSDIYFSMARGNATLLAMEKTELLGTNYRFIVPELEPDMKFSYASHKTVTEYKNAKAALGVDTVPVLVGPVSYLLMSKPAEGVEESFSTLSLLDGVLPVYREVVAELKEAGASWIQFDEPALVLDLDAHKLEAFTHAYSELESSLSGLNVLIETYFADVPAKASFKTVTGLKGVTAIGLSLVRGTETVDLIKSVGFPSDKFLFARVVDGRNMTNDLAASLSTLEALEAIVGKDKLVVSTSRLLHTAAHLGRETQPDSEIRSWLAFAAQKMSVVVNALSKIWSGQKDEIHTNMCCSKLNETDADVGVGTSEEKLLSVDSHYPRMPLTVEIVDQMLAVLETNILWVIPDCKLKTDKYAELKPALTVMVEAAKHLCARSGFYYKNKVE